jgi:Uma2 family endonuclease
MAVGIEVSVAGSLIPFADSVFRLSLDQYMEMVRLGIIAEDDRVELLEGVLVTKISKGTLHVYVTGQIFDALRTILPPGWYVGKEDPLALPDSMPEPDCAVIRGTRRDYLERPPRFADVALIVEVADTSLPHDREWKRRTYARAAIPFFWLANLVDRRIEVYSDPTGPAESPDYRTVWHVGPDEELSLVIDSREVARMPVRDLLP